MDSRNGELRRKRDMSVSYLNVTLWKMGVPEFSFYKSCEMMRWTKKDNMGNH